MKKGLLLIIAAALCISCFTGCEKKKSKKSDNESKTVSKYDLKRMRSTSLSNLKQITMGIMSYSDDFDGYMPADLSKLSDYLGGSTTAETILSSPYTKDKKGYIYCAPQIQMAKIQSPATFPVAFENPKTLPENTDDIAVAYADGHVAAVPMQGADKLTPAEIAKKLVEKMSDRARDAFGQKVISTAEKDI